MKTTLLLLALLWSWIASEIQAATIQAGGKIDHGRWLTFNLIAAAILATLAMLILWPPLEWLRLAHGVALMASAYTLAFRPLLNHLRGLPWWWMGPRLHNRSGNDSRYDTAFHWLAYITTGALYNGKLPALYATAVEVVALVVLIIF